MKIAVSPAKGRIVPSGSAALSSSRSEVVPTATIRPPLARAAFSASAVSHETVPHSEWGSISAPTAAALNAARADGGRIVAVGTTSLRLLESAAAEDGVVKPFAGDTAIFITPGYRFRAVDILITNFHLPRSTLFMLVSAFSGLDTMKRAYAQAIGKGYRFYSYGDACLLFRDKSTR